MPHPKNASRLTQRMYIAVQGYARGLTQRQIAEEIGVNQSTVSYLLKQAGEIMFREMRPALNAMKSQQTQAHLHVFREAMMAWEKSKQPRKRSVATKRKKKDGKDADDDTLLRVEQEETCGDVQYLAMATRAQEAIARLWGLNAPVKIQTREPGPLEALPEAELVEQMERELADIAKRVHGAPLAIDVSVNGNGHFETEE